MTQNYLEGIFDKLDNLVTDIDIADMSFDLSDGQLDVVHSYLHDVYRKSHNILRQNLRSLTIDSISITESNKAVASKYVEDVYSKVGDNNKDSSMEKHSLEEEEEEEYFPPPSITVIEDKTAFNVNKYVLGIQQEGYGSAFFDQTHRVNHLKDKARKMSDKESKDVVGTKTKAEKEEKKTVKRNTNEHLNEEEYIQRLIKGSFSGSQKENKEEAQI